MFCHVYTCGQFIQPARGQLSHFGTYQFRLDGQKLACVCVRAQVAENLEMMIDEARVLRLQKTCLFLFSLSLSLGSISWLSWASAQLTRSGCSSCSENGQALSEHGLMTRSSGLFRLWSGLGQLLAYRILLRVSLSTVQSSISLALFCLGPLKSADSGPAVNLSTVFGAQQKLQATQ